MSELTDKIERSLKGLDGLLLAIKATGGYKFRKQLQGTDQEIDGYIAETVPKVQGLLIALIIAEEMLQESCPEKKSWKNLWRGCEGKRWDEYVSRKKAAVEDLKAKLEADAKKIILQRVPGKGGEGGQAVHGAGGSHGPDRMDRSHSGHSLVSAVADAEVEHGSP